MQRGTQNHVDYFQLGQFEYRKVLNQSSYLLLYKIQHHQLYLTTDQHQKVVDFYDIKGIASYIIKSLGYEFEINKGY